MGRPARVLRGRPMFAPSNSCSLEVNMPLLFAWLIANQVWGARVRGRLNCRRANATGTVGNTQIEQQRDLGLSIFNRADGLTRM